MVGDGTAWKLVETWNEWGNGSSVERGRQTRIDSTGEEVLDLNGVTFGGANVHSLADHLPPPEEGRAGRESDREQRTAT
jgi:hypothetical protein